MIIQSIRVSSFNLAKQLSGLIRVDCYVKAQLCILKGKKTISLLFFSFDRKWSFKYMLLNDVKNLSLYFIVSILFCVDFVFFCRLLMGYQFTSSWDGIESPLPLPWVLLLQAHSGVVILSINSPSRNHRLIDHILDCFWLYSPSYFNDKNK